MILNIILIITICLIAFMIYAATKSNSFRYQRSGVINAPADKIFPYLIDFQRGHLWSPFEQTDPNLKKVYLGPNSEVGSIMEFDGNKDAGTGKLILLEIIPNQLVKINLIMTKPMKCDNFVEYALTPEANGTRFTWSMYGNTNYLGKCVSVFIDCEKMCGDQFSIGIENLKKLIENK